MDIVDRLKKLRGVLGLSQEGLADAGAIARLDVQQFEQGNKHNSHAVRRGIARGCGLSQDDLDAYLEGAISLEEAIFRKRAHAQGQRSKSGTMGAVEGPSDRPSDKFPGDGAKRSERK